MDASSEKIEQLTTVEHLAARHRARELARAMVQGVESAGLRPRTPLEFCAFQAAARSVAAAFAATMGKAEVRKADELAEELAAEQLARAGYSAAGSH